MNSIVPRDDDQEDYDDDYPRRDREITLGTTMILGIFFALAVLCAVFFGFGYQLGRRSTPTVMATDPASTGSSFGVAKPAPGSPLAAANANPAANPTSAPSSAVAVPYIPPPYVQPTRAKVSEPPAAGDIAPAESSAAAPPKSAPRPQPIAAPAPSGPGAMVQIAAVSHQEDADLLVDSLKRRGYNVAVHSEPQDKLLHVQVGPFATHKDADAMRQRLLNDGFNAIVKDIHP